MMIGLGFRSCPGEELVFGFLLVLQLAVVVYCLNDKLPSLYQCSTNGGLDKKIIPLRAVPSLPRLQCILAEL